MVIGTGIHVTGTAAGTAPDDSGTASISSFADLMSFSPPRGFNLNPILRGHGTGSVSGFTNIAPFGWIEDPLDSDKFLLYVGEFLGNSRAESRIRCWSAFKATPYEDFTDEGVVIAPGSGTDEDDTGASGGSVWKEGSTLYYYYVGLDGTGNGSETICLATSTDGRTFTKQGQVLVPDGVNEFNLTDPIVRKYGATWYMYASSKDVNQLPIGIVLFTSSDGLSWTRDSIVLSLGSARAYDGLLIEGTDVQLIGSDYVMMYTCCSGGNIWSIGIATSTNPDGPFTKESRPWFQIQDGNPDDFSVACPVLAELTTNKWYLFYQNSIQAQPASVWNICFARFKSAPEDWPLGYLDGLGSWTAEAFFRTQTDICPVTTVSRAIQAVNNAATFANPGFSTVIADHPVDVTPAASPNASVKITITCNNTNANAFTAGFYLMEGASIITGIYIGGNQLKHLRSAGWTNFLAISNDAIYTVEVHVTSTSTYNVTVNGSLLVTAAACFTNVVTKVDKIRLEKSGQTSAFAFYGDLQYKTGGSTTIIDIGQ